MSSRDSRFKHLRRLTWAQWKVQDPFDSTKYTSYYLSIYEPTYQVPWPSLLIKVSNGSGSMFQRFCNLETCTFVIPECYHERIQDALSKAKQVADRIEREWRTMQAIRDSLPGQSFTRTPEGDLIAQAERIIGGEGNGMR